jgi:hypothetical protein
MNFYRGYADRVLINVPPEHAKSTTFTVNYTVWQIVKNPDVRIVIVSKGLRLAGNFLYEIKEKLTSPVYREMQLAFAPDGGWQDPDYPWTADRIYVRGQEREHRARRPEGPDRSGDGVKGHDLRPAGRPHHPGRHHRRGQRPRGRDQLRKINRDISSRLPDGGLLLSSGPAWPRWTSTGC